MAVFCADGMGRPELERALRFGDRTMWLEQLVVFAGAGRGDEMPVRVAVPGTGRSFAGGGMADYRPRRGATRGAPCCGDEEWGEERGGEKTGESHEGPLCGFRGIPMLPRGLRDLHGNSDFCGQNGKFSRCDSSDVVALDRSAFGGRCRGTSGECTSLHAAVGDVAGIASGDVGAFVRVFGSAAARGGVMRRSLVGRGLRCRVAVHGGAGYGGAWNIDVRHGESGGGSGCGRQRRFREGLRGEGWSGEEQGEGRDGEETRKLHDGTWRGDVRGETMLPRECGDLHGNSGPACAGDARLWLRCLAL
jgi:hypothetical protein